MSISCSLHTRPVGLCGLHQSSRSAPSIARANKSSGIRGVSPDRSRGTRRSSHPARSTTSMIGPYAGSSVTTRGGRPSDLGKTIEHRADTHWTMRGKKCTSPGSSAHPWRRSCQRAAASRKSSKTSV